MLEHPFLKDLKSFYLYSLVWLILAASYFILIYLGIQVPLFTALPDSIVFIFLLASFGLGLWYPVKFINYEKATPLRFIITHLSGGVLAVGLWLYFGYIIVSLIVADKDNYSLYFTATLGWRILIGTLLYFLIVLFYYLVTYYKEYKNRLIREADLKALITEAELNSLKFQINPHFIFNSLNSISSLTIDDSVKAGEMILKLADFLRYTISNNTRMMNSLEDELNNANRYLDIEKIRFEDKFDYEQRISPECLKIQVPNMILQPLFENAIKHAVYESLEKVNILIICRAENGFLNIILENTYEKSSVRKGSGIGLKNIAERMSLIYNRNDLFRFSSDDNIFRVNLYIPIDSVKTGIK